MITFSAYWTDKLGAAIKARCLKPYPVEFHPGGDLNAIIAAVNQGIDSHLEAIHFKQSEGDHGRIKIVFEPESVPVLVRRLMEIGNEASESLASSICSTLDIELI